MARDLRRARTRCSKLRKDAALLDSEEPMPTEHLRAVEHHLAALERWLVGSGSTGFDDVKLLQDEMGATGLEHEENAASFAEYFSASEGEYLVKALPCFVQAGSFNYPGKLYMSTMRLCFRACVFGATSTFACPWRNVSQLRFTAQVSSKTFPIFVTLKTPAAFAGKTVGQLCVCLYELAAVGAFDKCSNYFSGCDIFGHWDQEEGDAKAMARTLTHRKSSLIAARARNGSVCRAMQSVLEDEGTVWQLQRRVTVWNNKWKVPFLPHDGLKRRQWMTIGQKGYAPHPFLEKAVESSPTGSERDAPDDGEPPISRVDFMGQERPCSWHSVVDAHSDKDGWQYAVDFYLQPDKWTPYCSNFSHVRRRKWQPIFSSSHTIDLPSGSPRGSPKVAKLNSSLLDRKGLTSGQATVFEADIGDIPMQSLGAALESDDWASPGQLMQMYFEDLQAQDLEIHDWSDVSGVKGLTRSVEMRIPVPPAPMCPKETRCTCTWHVSTSPVKIVLESTTMSLDVPYGTSFNVVVSDTFTREQGATCTRMKRVCAVEWVSAIWMKSLVEQTVPPQMKSAAERWAVVLQDWAGANGSWFS